jgi:type I restriction enzyme M protein
VPNEEIAGQGYNLYLPRYIDSSEAEDLQDIEAHLRGGIPDRDIDALEAYWQVCPQLREALFQPLRPGYLALAVAPAELKATITAHPQFVAFLDGMAKRFADWRYQASFGLLLRLERGCHPKAVIRELAEDLLREYRDLPLIDAYAVYQLLLDQWAETMQDDVYAISAEGWKAETYRLVETGKNGRTRDKGWACDLVPKDLLIRQLLRDDLMMLEALRGELEDTSSRLAELEEEHGGEEGAFSELEKLNKVHVAARIKEIRRDPAAAQELRVLREWLQLSDEEAKTRKMLKALEADLDDQAYEIYGDLSESDVRELVVHSKWLGTLEQAIAAEVERVSQQLTSRLKELGERYGEALPQISDRVEELEAKVAGHLERMGFAWS